MATIIKLEKGWKAQVRRKGVSKSKTFKTKVEAQAWAFEIEKKIQNNDYSDIPNITFAALIDRYIKQVSVHKKGYRSERFRLLRIAAMPLGNVRLIDLQEHHFQQWRDERLSKVSPASVLREWNTLSSVINTAISEWKYLKENYLKNVKKPATPKARTRRYTDEEIERIAFVAGFDFAYPSLTSQSRTAEAMLFAIETAMRAGEICNAKWQDLRAEGKILHIPTSKNGHARDVPLSMMARKIIQHLALIRKEDDDRIFQINSATLDANFRKLKDKAGLGAEDLHFHDTRREALSRMAKKVEVMTLAKISGHRDIKILLNTYYAPDMEEIANLLD